MASILSLPFFFYIENYILAGISGSILILSIIQFDRDIKKSRKKDEVNLEMFKNNADKILVSLEDYTIKSNSWTDEIVVNNSKYIGAWNQISGNPDKNIQKIARNPNCVYLKLKYNGNIENYNFYIEKDRQTLEILLGLKKETYLYIDKKYPEKKYLDLEFLR